MIISTQQYTRGLYEALSNKKSNQEIKRAIHNFGLILVRQQDLSRGAELIESFQKLWDQEYGELTAKLTNARKLEPSAKETIVGYLKFKTGLVKINLQEKIDKTLIGGFILRYNSSVLDGSLRSSLENLKNKISN